MKSLLLTIVSMLAIVVLSSCEYDVATETTVHPDGSLDKTILIEDTDSATHLFNVNTWQKKRIEGKREPTVIDSMKSSSADSATLIKIKQRTSFEKRFNSVDEANAELSILSDTLLQVTSKFEKRFRWFYTYMTYSETYHKLNKMKLDPRDYFTVEDYAFIERLPAEGKAISKADEHYLSSLRNKIFDEYAEKALYNEWLDLTFIVVTSQPGIDSLRKRTKDFRDAFEKIEAKKIDVDKLILAAIDSFNIPIDQSKIAEFEKVQRNFLKKINFISSASDGKFVNRINLPWTVVNSNADSVSGNSLFWAPPTIKFLLKDYTMYGECRKLNWWAIIVSVLVIGFTGYLFIRKRN